MDTYLPVSSSSCEAVAVDSRRFLAGVLSTMQEWCGQQDIPCICRPRRVADLLYQRTLPAICYTLMTALYCVVCMCLVPVPTRKTDSKSGHFRKMPILPIQTNNPQTPPPNEHGSFGVKCCNFETIPNAKITWSILMYIVNTPGHSPKQFLYDRCGQKVMIEKVRER